MGIVSANRKAFEKFDTRPKPLDASDSSRTLTTPPVSPQSPPFKCSPGGGGGGGCSSDDDGGGSPRPRSHPSARLRLRSRPHHQIEGEAPMTNDEKIDSLIALLEKPVVVNPSFPETIRHRHDWEDLEWHRGGIHDDDGHGSSRTDSRANSGSSTERYDDMVDSLLSALEETGI